MHNDLSRRSVMAAGVAVALAAPLAALPAASASQAEDWPEFAPFVTHTLAMDAGFNANDGHAIDTHGAAQHALVEAMWDRAPQNDRQWAMLIAIAIAYEAKNHPPGGPFESFSLRLDVEDTDFCGVAPNRIRHRLLARDAREIVARKLLPEVPFTFPEGV